MSCVQAGCLGLLLWLGQSLPPRYTAASLGCAVYRETVRSEIASRAGPVTRTERAGRDGVVLLRGAEADSGLAVELWYDSLVVWREGPEGKALPDTDGLLGGRWRGRLDGAGRYSRLAAPFVPDEVAEIADLRGLAEDFLPLLPDSALSDGAVYRWTRRGSSDSTTMVDSIAVPVHREVSEEGRLTWTAARGPVRWERSITVTATISPGRPFARGVTSTVKQSVRVTREPDDCRAD